MTDFRVQNCILSFDITSPENTKRITYSIDVENMNIEFKKDEFDKIVIIGKCR